MKNKQYEANIACLWLLFSLFGVTALAGNDEITSFNSDNQVIQEVNKKEFDKELERLLACRTQEDLNKYFLSFAGEEERFEQFRKYLSNLDDEIFFETLKILYKNECSGTNRAVGHLFMYKLESFTERFENGEKVGYHLLKDREIEELAPSFRRMLIAINLHGYLLNRDAWKENEKNELLGSARDLILNEEIDVNVRSLMFTNLLTFSMTQVKELNSDEENKRVGEMLFDIAENLAQEISMHMDNPDNGDKVSLIGEVVNFDNKSLKNKFEEEKEVLLETIVDLLKNPNATEYAVRRYLKQLAGWKTEQILLSSEDVKKIKEQNHQFFEKEKYYLKVLEKLVK